MAFEPGLRSFGPKDGQIRLMTSRDGLAAQAGHDLTIEVSAWSAELTVADDLAPSGLAATIDMTSLVVRDGTGGVKPLTDRDRREIAATARRVLGTDRHPDATFVASGFEQTSGGNGIVAGTLTLAGVERPVQLQIASTGPGVYQATTTVRHTDFGIKPYTAFLGALRVSDAVRVVIDVDFP